MIAVTLAKAGEAMMVVIMEQIPPSTCCEWRLARSRMRTFPTVPAEMAARYEWIPQRMDPALAILQTEGLVRAVNALDGKNFLAAQIRKTDTTRRFVKSST